MEQMGYKVPGTTADYIKQRVFSVEICQFLFFLIVLILLHFTKLLYRCKVFTVISCNNKPFNMEMIKSISHSNTACSLSVWRKTSVD